MNQLCEVVGCAVADELVAGWVAGIVVASLIGLLPGLVHCLILFILKIACETTGYAEISDLLTFWYSEIAISHLPWFSANVPSPKWAFATNILRSECLFRTNW